MGKKILIDYSEYKRLEESVNELEEENLKLSESFGLDMGWSIVYSGNNGTAQSRED